MEELKKITTYGEYRERMEAEKELKTAMRKLRSLHRDFKKHREMITSAHLEYCQSAIRYMDLCLESFGNIPKTIKVELELWIDEEEEKAKAKAKAEQEGNK